jgi:hypothetical protein
VVRAALAAVGVAVLPQRDAECAPSSAEPFGGTAWAAVLAVDAMADRGQRHHGLVGHRGQDLGHAGVSGDETDPVLAPARGDLALADRVADRGLNLGRAAAALIWCPSAASRRSAAAVSVSRISRPLRRAAAATAEGWAPSAVDAVTASLTVARMVSTSVASVARPSSSSSAVACSSVKVSAIAVVLLIYPARPVNFLTANGRSTPIADTTYAWTHRERVDLSSDASTVSGNSNPTVPTSLASTAQPVPAATRGLANSPTPADGGYHPIRGAQVLPRR